MKLKWKQGLQAEAEFNRCICAFWNGTLMQLLKCSVSDPEFFLDLAESPH